MSKKLSKVGTAVVAVVGGAIGGAAAVAAASAIKDRINVCVDDDDVDLTAEAEKISDAEVADAADHIANDTTGAAI